MTKLKGWKLGCVVFVVCAATTIAAKGQTFTTLVDFDGEDGANPVAPLVQGLDGNLYGTTSDNGTSSFCCGTIFQLTRAGTLTTLHNFLCSGACSDGDFPNAGLVLADDGSFYGTANLGGNSICHPSGCGTVFKVTPAGEFAVLHRFNMADGANPFAGLILASDGNLYGTTYGGGAFGFGTVFRITPQGQLTTLHNFARPADGAYPVGEHPVGGLIQATNGNFYGTTEGGYGLGNAGTVFRISADGVFKTLATFCACHRNDPANPRGALLQAADGNFYGTSTTGGYFDEGTIFMITPSGTLSTVYTFCNCGEGGVPEGALIQATDGNFYGTTSAGGTGHFGTEGTVFRFSPENILTPLYSFCSLIDCDDGAVPAAGLLQATDGKFYGTTQLLGTGGGAPSTASTWASVPL